VKNRLILICLFAAFLVVSCSKPGNAFAPENAVATATLTVIGPDGETLLQETRAGIKDGCSVFDLTSYLCRENKIALVSSGVGKSVYVKGIGGFMELARGGGSGWIYIINGDASRGSKSCGAVTLSDGDSVVWRYTLNLGKDIGVDVG
jgi:hypothetical protein